MKALLTRALVLCACVLALTLTANAQDKAAQKDRGPLGVTLLKGSGKAAVIVVSSAAKVGWVVTKFTAKHLVKPTAKLVLVKVPATALKLTGKSAMRLTPVAAKLSKTYLKSKLPI